MSYEAIMGFLVGIVLETFLGAVLAILLVAKKIIEEYKQDRK